MTPVGTLFGSAQVAAGIAVHNAILTEAAERHGVLLLDITTLSLLAAEEPALVSRDGLHYSREMYRRWVELMLPSVRACLEIAHIEETQ